MYTQKELISLLLKLLLKKFKRGRKRSKFILQIEHYCDTKMSLQHYKVKRCDTFHYQQLINL